MKIRWGKLAAQLGVVYWIVGLGLVFLGWNGAASYDGVAAQIPYVISGGLAGLCLVVIGAAVVVVQNARADRAALQGTLVELHEAVERMAATGGGGGAAASVGASTATGADTVVAGPSSYHRPSCRQVEGQAGAATMTRAAAEAQGLTPCRACNPAG